MVNARRLLVRPATRSPHRRPANLLLSRAGKASSHELKECSARQVVLARCIRSNPASELDHGLTAFGRRVWNANLRSVLALLVRLKHALGKSIAEVQLGEIGSVCGLDRAGIGEVAGGSDAD